MLIASVDSTNNRLFDARTLTDLAAVSTWPIVADLPGLEGRPAPDRSRAAWRTVNRHAHPFPELLFALDGSTVYGLGAAPRRCPRRSVFFFAPGVPHDRDYPPDCPPLRHLWCRIVQDHLFATVIRVAANGARTAEWGFPISFRESGIDFWRLWSGVRATGSPAVSQLVLRSLISGIAACLIEEGYRQPRHAADSLKDAIDAICRHIESTAGRDVSLDSMARLSGYSKFHLWRAFKERTGLSLHDFVDRCRVRAAATWIGDGLARREIAERLGFSGASSFSRWCHKHRAALPR